MLIEEIGMVVEFDGQLKYQRKQDECDGPVDPGEVVWKEKVREDLIRAEDLGVGRLIWSDLWGAARRPAADRLWRTARRRGLPPGWRQAS